MVKKWIQKAISRQGSLHKSLEIAPDKKIPMILLTMIIKTHAGETINNPTKTGKRRIKVTRAIEQRAILARNLKRLKNK